MPRKKNDSTMTTAEVEQMKVLLANGNSYYATARELQRSPHTVKKYATRPQTAIAIENTKQELADMFETLARKMVESISSEDIQRLSAYQKTLSAAVSIDKMRLLRNESTVNQSTIFRLFLRDERARLGG